MHEALDIVDTAWEILNSHVPDTQVQEMRRLLLGDDSQRHQQALGK